MAEYVAGMSRLQARIRALGGVGLQVMTILASQTTENARRNAAPFHKTSILLNSILPAQITPTTAVVEARARYAGFVELGTRPHIIRPRNARLLAWPATAAGRRLTGSARKAMYTRKGAAKLGGWRYAMYVHHPGTKPQPFLLPGARDALRQTGLADVVVQEWNRAA